jgi:hypothetical protein
MRVAIYRVVSVRETPDAVNDLAVGLTGDALYMGVYGLVGLMQAAHGSEVRH